MLVQKFGGGILATRQDFERVAGIIKATNPDTVVVSAVQGVTDELISLLETARSGKDFSKNLDAMRKRHASLTNGKIKEIDATFGQIQKTLQEIRNAGEYSEKTYAQVASRGEYLSALVLQSHLPEYAFWPSENGLIARGSNSYLNARCDFKASKTPLQKSIVTGFYGVNENGEACLFGRGGSDYTAGAIAKLRLAKTVQFWKNVDGFMTADPKIVRSAKLIKELSFEEAAEICRFGAKVLHPSSLEPLVGTGTNVEIKNILQPNAGGTVIRGKTAVNEVAAITGKQKIAVVSISGNEMVESFGIAAKILTKVASANIAVDAIATGQANISFSVDEKESNKAKQAVAGFEQFQTSTKPGLCLIGVVGNGLKGNPTTTSRIFSALANEKIKVEMITQGASEIDLSIIVEQYNYEKAINAIHKEFFGK